VKKYAERQHMTVSAVIRLSLSRGLAAMELEAARQIVAEEAEAPAAAATAPPQHPGRRVLSPGVR
jgi:hypothetical protein